MGTHSCPINLSHFVCFVFIVCLGFLTKRKKKKNIARPFYEEETQSKMHALCCAGVMLNDDMLNLMALRYGGASGHMTLESFISLILRLDCMHSK